MCRIGYFNEKVPKSYTKTILHLLHLSPTNNYKDLKLLHWLYWNWHFAHSRLWRVKKISKQFSYLWPLVLQMFLFVFIVLPLCRWSYISKPWTLYVHYFDTMVDILERPCGGNLVRNLPKSSNSSNTIFECNLWNDSFLAYIVRNSRTIACLIWLELIL